MIIYYYQSHLFNTKKIALEMKTYVYIIIAVSLIAGATNTLGFTLQNKQKVVQDGIQKKFYHPYVQSCVRFISNFIILLVYIIEKKYKTAKKQDETLMEQEQEIELEEKKVVITKRTYLLFIIPMLLDEASVVGFYIALNFIDGSVYQMLRGGIIIFTYFFSYKFLKARPTKVKMFGCAVALSGLIIVGVVNFIYSTNDSSEQTYTLVGYGLILVSIIIGAIKFIYEEHLLTHYKFTPFLIVGMQGFYGLFFAAIFLPILSIIPCNLKQDACVILDSGESVIEDFSIYWRQVMDNPLIITAVLVVLCSMAINNLFGVMIAKYAKSLTRSICDVSRTVIIWMVGLIVSATLGQDNGIYKWQSLRWQQILGESIGFSILILGNLIYYGALKIKYFAEEDKQEKALYNSLISQKEQKS